MVLPVRTREAGEDPWVDIVDMNNATIGLAYTKMEADQIVRALNSHEPHRALAEEVERLTAVGCVCVEGRTCVGCLARKALANQS